MSKTYKKPYTKSKRFDSSCRNHGSCGYCYWTRTYFDKKKRLYWRLDLEDYLKNGKMAESG
jgi:hypothetical protein